GYQVRAALGRAVQLARLRMRERDRQLRRPRHPGAYHAVGHTAVARAKSSRITRRLVHCHTSQFVARLTETSSVEAHCPRCGSSRHRKPNSTDRTCALLITSAL